MNDNTTISDPLGGRWCIIRTSPGKTLALADSLAGAGFDVWTPRQVQTRTRPRSTIKVEREMPIAPTFVFARASHIVELSALRAEATLQHPAFSIFRHAGRVPLIADAEVVGLRRAEERARVNSRRSKRRAYVLGQRLKMTQGAYTGMTGVVQDIKGRFVAVNFGGNIEMKIDSWRDDVDVVEDASPHLGAAA